MRADEDFPRKIITPCRQTASAGVVVCDGTGKIVSCSDSAAQVFGGQAIDQEGSQIPVEFSLLKVDSANERLFLMNLRHAKVA